jgi:hypothetical protein
MAIGVRKKARMVKKMVRISVSLSVVHGITKHEFLNSAPEIA